MSESVKVLAVEPWFGGSHRAALEGLAAHSSAEFKLITLPSRFWKWRMQGSAVSLASTTREVVDSGFTPDVILASSMLNVPAFVGLLRPVLQSVPVVLYMHENQLTYALREGEEPDHTYGFINYLSCLAS
ncbi:MAG: DUF3524 domain-containing protein, partial [Rhodothermales bacterium]|nr:DUF3524 domain-containing protein [Rhodothermales bacterium]